MSKQTKAKTESRGRGRPASFPGKETVAFLATIPAETRDQLRAVATKREEAINVTLARFIENGFKAATRARKSK